jgi:hypothetical protein
MNSDIQHIVVIESLEASEDKTGSELYTDIIERYINLHGNRSPIRSRSFHAVESKQEMLEVLDNLLASAEGLQNGLVIHFEMHGSADLDGLITANGDLVTWSELVEKFRFINLATVNQLYLTIATCYGRHLFEAVQPELKSPYRGYISASQSVTVQEVMDSFTDVYERLVTDGNLIRSYLDSDAEESRFYYKDSEETFRQLMEMTFDRLQNDPTYKDEILDHSELRQAYECGYIPEELLTSMMRHAFVEIYNRHKQAFNFEIQS